MALLALAVVGTGAVAPAIAAKGKARSRAEFCEKSLLQFFETSPPTVLTKPLEPSLLAQYAVLRRPAGPQDAVPAINDLDGEIMNQLSGYYASELRQLAVHPHGNRYLFITGLGPRASVLPARCMPKSMRRQRPKLVVEARIREHEPYYCIAGSSARSGAALGASCEAMAEVAKGVGYYASFSAHGKPVVRVVPDGVAAVRVEYHGGPAIETPVSENAVAFTPPKLSMGDLRATAQRLMHRYSGNHLSRRASHQAERALLHLILQIADRLTPAHVKWLDSTGKVFRDIVPNPRAALDELLAASQLVSFIG